MKTEIWRPLKKTMKPSLSDSCAFEGSLFKKYICLGREILAQRRCFSGKEHEKEEKSGEM